MDGYDAGWRDRRSQALQVLDGRVAPRRAGTQAYGVPRTAAVAAIEHHLNVFDAEIAPVLEVKRPSHRTTAASYRSGSGLGYQQEDRELVRAEEGRAPAPNGWFAHAFERLVRLRAPRSLGHAGEGGGGSALCGARLLASRTQRLDEPVVDASRSAGLAQVSSFLVELHVLIDPAAAGVADVGADRWRGRQRAVAHDVGFDQRRRRVADRCDGLVLFEKRGTKRIAVSSARNWSRLVMPPG